MLGRWTLLLCLVCCFSLSIEFQAEAQLNKTVTIKLKRSNMHLLRGDKNILIDSGSKDEWPEVVKELSNYGVTPQNVNLVILTHGHADHAGNAKKFQDAGATIALGKGDLPLVTVGHNDELKPTNFTAYFIRMFIDPEYDLFFPNLVVDGDYDLTAFNFPGRLVPMPGHTEGSIALTIVDGSCFVGDMILGGFFGGALFPTHAGEHYFHANRDKNRSNIERLVRGGAKTFYLGHGGPVSRESVINAFDIRL